MGVRLNQSALTASAHPPARRVKAGSDCASPRSPAGQPFAIKDGDDNGTGAFTVAVPGTDYQAPLVSGTNIKTINGSSVLGAGDLVVSGTPSAASAVFMQQNLGGF